MHKDPRSPARAQLYLGARGLCSGSVAWRRRWARGQGHGVDAGRTGQSAHGEGRKDVCGRGQLGAPVTVLPPPEGGRGVAGPQLFSKRDRRSSLLLLGRSGGSK